MVGRGAMDRPLRTLRRIAFPAPAWAGHHVPMVASGAMDRSLRAVRRDAFPVPAWACPRGAKDFHYWHAVTRPSPFPAFAA